MTFGQLQLLGMGRLIQVLVIGSFLIAGCGDMSPCSIPPGTTEEISKTPRADINLELLALRLSNGVTANQAVYDRLTADVKALRALEPKIASISYFAPHDGRTIGLVVSKSTMEKMKQGEYQAWNCLNEHYQVEDVEFQGWTQSFNCVWLQLKGIYELTRIVPLYQSLPQIEEAEPSLHIGDGATICVTPEGEFWHYVFDEAGGDCPSGCTTHKLFYFVTVSSGNISFIGTWDTESGAPKPQWSDKYWGGNACR